MKRFYGAFSLGKLFIEDHAEILMNEVFSRMIVLKADMRWDSDSIDYVAYCPELFDEVPVGHVAPHYRIIINTEQGVVTAERL